MKVGSAMASDGPMRGGDFPGDVAAVLGAPEVAGEHARRLG
jgi:hypothetical protein